MKYPAQAFYDGHKLTIASIQDQKVLKDELYSTVKSYLNQRKYFLLKTQGHKMKVVLACQALTDFVLLYKDYSLKAITRRIVALEPQLYTLMPNPEMKQSHWCFKIETIIAISNAYQNQYASNTIPQHTKR
jgi:hypothetical protein